MKITEYGNNKKPRKMTQIELIKAEIERILNLFPKKPNGEVLPIDQNAYNLISDLKIFIESLPAEQPCEDLEYLATSLEETIGTSPHSRETIISYLQQAAQWQKEQMMKPAVDATCVLLPPPDVFKVLICHEVTDKLTVGQKVKVILMEDEQCSTE